MHQTRQFTKRRPQSPLPAQPHQSIDGLQVGINKPKSGLAIQSSAPIHTSRSFKKITEQHDYAHHHEHTQQNASVHEDAYHAHEETRTHQNHFGQHDHHDHDHHSHSHETLYQPHQDHSHFHAHDHHDHHGHHDHHDHHDHHHGHDHHDHNNHQHGYHQHDHHQHDHHDHHDHHHTHFPQVYTQPLPSYSSVFATLAPPQKALFTFFIGYILIGMILFAIGAARESLAVVGFSYLVLFDAFGILNNFISSVLKYNPAFANTSTKRPYGVKRFDIVFAFANAIFLLFGTMFTTKESLEHLLVEDHHNNGHPSYPFGLLLMLLLAVASSFGSSVKLGNHDQLLNLTRKTPAEYNEKMGFSMETPIQLLTKNIYSLSIVSMGSIIFLLNLLGMSFGTFDKLIAFVESGLMLYLGGPTAVALAKVLLQTMPDGTNVDYYLGSIKQQIPGVLAFDKVHLWQNEYGKLVGTLEIHSRPDADEDDIISQSLAILEPLVKDGEITISVTKMQ